MKRYRSPKVVEGQIKLQRGRIDGEAPDMCIFYGDNVPRCDRSLVMNSLCFDTFDSGRNELSPSFVDELESRGYDLDTLKFSIDRLPQHIEAQDD
jgi:hypothetical protein